MIEIINMNVLYAVAIMTSVILFRRVLMPFLKKNNLDLYDEIKLALLLMGYSFRDEKIKSIIEVTLELVKDLEKIAIAPEDKLSVAIEEISKKLFNDFGIELEDEVIELIIRVAVSTLPPTSEVENKIIIKSNLDERL